MSDDALSLAALRKRMEGAVSVLRTELAGIRTGRASPALLESINVTAYDSTMPLSQIGAISAPEPRLLVVNIWDKTLVAAADKAIRCERPGLNPSVDGQLLRIPMPPLNEERRTELARLAGRHAETTRVAVRNVRRDGMEAARRSEKELGRDVSKLHGEHIQKLTDEIVTHIDQLLAAKEKEIAQV